MKARIKKRKCPNSICPYPQKSCAYFVIFDLSESFSTANENNEKRTIFPAARSTEQNIQIISGATPTQSITFFKLFRKKRENF